MTRRLVGVLLAALLVVVLVPGSAISQVRFVNDAGDHDTAIDIKKVRLQNGSPGHLRRVRISTRVADITQTDYLTVWTTNRAGTTYKIIVWVGDGDDGWSMRQYRNGRNVQCSIGGTRPEFTLDEEGRVDVGHIYFHRKCVGRSTTAVKVRASMEGLQGISHDRTKWTRWASVR